MIMTGHWSSSRQYVCAATFVLETQMRSLSNEYQLLILQTCDCSENSHGLAKSVGRLSPPVRLRCLFILLSLYVAHALCSEGPTMNREMLCTIHRVYDWPMQRLLFSWHIHRKYCYTCAQHNDTAAPVIGQLSGVSSERYCVCVCKGYYTFPSIVGLTPLRITCPLCVPHIYMVLLAVAHKRNADRIDLRALYICQACRSSGSIVRIKCVRTRPQFIVGVLCVRVCLLLEDAWL